MAAVAWLPVLLLLLGVGPAASSSSSVAAASATRSTRSTPPFSWNTVPLFQQLCSVNATLEQPFEPARLQWLADTYPVVVIEHCQGQGPQAYDSSVGP